MTIAEVADKAGFESEFYFSRIFKKKMGVAPGEYRTMNSKFTSSLS
jgi:AraC-like DNA-binding protein